MTLVCVFTVPGPPVPKARPRLGLHGRRTYTPTKTRDAEARIGQYLFVKYPRLVPSTARLRIVARFHLKGVRGDSDNFVKLAIDGMQGRAFVNDSQVDQVDVTVTRRSLDPRTELEVWTLP